LFSSLAAGWSFSEDDFLAAAESLPRAVLLDLFGTLVDFDLQALPMVEIKGRRVISTVNNLSGLLADFLPAPSAERFHEAMMEASLEIRKRVEKDHREVSSLERFSRALKLAGMSGDREELAGELSRRHMKTIASVVSCPAARLAALRRLADKYPLALVSNFDRKETASEILEREGLSVLFVASVISDDFGWRKPAPEIFRHAASALGVADRHCLHVGDSLRADIEGAVACGMKAVWIGDLSGRGLAAGAEGELADVSELGEWLGIE
jgi:FMN phosphatase YigB (HAD superfamily)